MHAMDAVFSCTGLHPYGKNKAIGVQRYLRHKVII
jgi:hypothetical protein